MVDRYYSTVSGLKDYLLEAERRGMAGKQYEDGCYVSISRLETYQPDCIRDWLASGHDPNEGNLLDFCVSNGLVISAKYLINAGARIKDIEQIKDTTRYYLTEYFKEVPLYQRDYREFLNFLDSKYPSHKKESTSQKHYSDEEKDEEEQLEQENRDLRETLRRYQRKEEASGRLKRLREENRRLKQQMKRFR